MSFEIINNPLFTTIQDKGRFGFAHLGVTSGGVMDEYAYFYANKLLKNPLNTNERPRIEKYKPTNKHR